MGLTVAILGGAGGMGAAFGARLHQAGHQVTLLDVAAEAVSAINERGLVIESKAGGKQGHRVRATTRPADVGTVDLLINFVKCYHTESAIRSALPLLRPDSLVL